MIGLDTNILVRYIMQDDAKQAAKASHLLESLSASEPGFVSIVSVVELGWVLETSYALARAQVVAALLALLRTKELIVDRADHVAEALKTYAATTADLADCLIERSAQAAGCDSTVTFDVAASKTARMTLLR